MGNVCCGIEEERHTHGAWKDAETVVIDENGSFASSSSDEAYDTKATSREQLISLHAASRRRLVVENEEVGNNGTSEIGIHRNGKMRLKRLSISSTPVDTGISFVAPSFPKSKETAEFLLEAIDDNFIFDSIDNKTKIQFVRAMQPQKYDEGEWVMYQGDVGDYFYIVEDGRIAFHVSESKDSSSSKRDPSYFPPQVGTGSKGSTFGELALLYNTPRAASIRALTPLKLYKIDQLTFRSLLMSSQVQDRSNLLSLVQKLSIFQDLDQAKVSKLADAFTIVDFRPGERIVNKGDSGNVLYIVKSGNVKATDIGHGSSKFQDHILGEGDSFGERALITGQTRAANVSAVTPASLLAISKCVLEDIIGPIEQAVRQSYCYRWLSSIPLFEYLERDEIERCVKHLKEERFSKGDRVLTTKGKLYLIEEGHALMMIQKKDSNQEAGDCDDGEVEVGPTLVKFEKGDYFGDLLGHYKESDIEASHITVNRDKVATENTLNVESDMKCLTLLTSDVESVVGNMRRLSITFDPVKLMRGYKSKRQSRMSILKDMQSNLSHFDRIKSKRTSSVRNVSNLSRLNKHRIIGAGTFGKVWLVTPKTDTNENPIAYALKIVSKRHLLDQGLAATILREKNVMESIEHPFILHMVSSFQDENHLYFVMDLILGGQLFELIYPDGRKSMNENVAWKESVFYKSFGGEDERPREGLAGVGVRKAAFFSANIIEAFNHLHNRRIVYRDLKPENIMLNENGYCVLVDMGFAKVVLDKTYTLCGTPEYLAPEIIMSKGHDHVSDYWSFGCLLFELIVGQTPFFKSGINQLALFKNIVKAHYVFPDIADKLAPDDCSSFNKELGNWKNLVSRLLKPKPTKRYGNLRNGIDDILDHNWFANVNFNRLRNQSLPAPWVPTIVDPLDESCFGKVFEEQDKQDVAQNKLSSKEQDVFKVF